MTSATRGALGGGRRDRLLAEGRQAALDRGQRQLRVRRRGRRDHDAVDARGQQLLDRINRRGTVFRGDLL